MNNLFPVFLDLRERTVLVIGGGAVAYRRIEKLLECGARVRVVSPAACEGVLRLAESGRLRWERRVFRADDLEDAGLAILATDDPALVAKVRAEARRRRVLLNCAQKGEAGDFHVPAVVRRAGVALAISSGGANPRLSARLRKALESWLSGLRLGAEDFKRVPRARRRLGHASYERAVREEERIEELEGSEDLEEASRTSAAEPKFEADAEGEEAGAAFPSHAGPPPVRGRVYLVGAGPGAPWLLTLRAKALLERADVVYYDRLVSSGILELASKRAELVYVGKEVGCAHRANIAELMIRSAREGRVVVRLKGGDPNIFARAGEEMLALARAGVAYEVIPGVSALSAVPAAAGIPLTFRGLANEVVVRSGHRVRPERPHEAQEGPGETTFVYFMAATRLARVIEELLAEGIPPETPAVVISRGTLPDQEVRSGTLKTLLDRSVEDPPPTPALLVVGSVAAFPDVREFERLLEEHAVWR